MVDEIRLPKVLSSLSATHRVKELNRRQTKMNQRRFGSHLKEEEERDRTTEEDREEGRDREERENETDALNVLSVTEQAPDLARKQEEEPKKEQGKLIDIVV